MLPDEVLLQVRGLRKYFPVKRGMFRRSPVRSRPWMGLI